MKKVIIYLVVCAALLISSCNSGVVVPTKEYYAGNFTYFADAATMVDCATGRRFTISNEGDYLNTERKYISMGGHGSSIFIEFFGKQSMEQSMEGDKMIQVLVIDTLIGLDQTIMCNPDATVTGIYEGSTPDSKYIIRVRPDYTYTESQFSIDGKEQVSSGRWYLSSSAELIKIQEQPKSDASTFEIVPAQNALVKNSGGKPLVLTKVYL